MNTDALAFLDQTMCELSMRRHDAIRPNLTRTIAAFTPPHVPVTMNLFGDNLQTQLGDIRASNKISKATAPQRFDKVRPYGRPHTRVPTYPPYRESQERLNFYPTASIEQSTHQRRLINEKGVNFLDQEATPVAANEQRNKNIMQNLQVSNLKRHLPLLSYLNTRVNSFQADQLSHNLCEWHELTSDPEVFTYNLE